MIALDNTYTAYDSEGFPKMYTLNDELIVLVSLGPKGDWDKEKYGFQYGWSTVCHRKNARQLLMDARIIKYVYEKFIVPDRRNVDLLSEHECVPVRDFFESLGIENEYVGTIASLDIVNVPKGMTDWVVDANVNGAEFVLSRDF